MVNLFHSESITALACPLWELSRRQHELGDGLPGGRPFWSVSKGRWRGVVSFVEEPGALSILSFDGSGAWVVVNWIL